MNYTIWIPPGVKTLRGVIVHQHGCGEGSAKRIRIHVRETNGDKLARIFEVRCYS
ncbi:MAG: hypothetical protein ACKV2V_11210 [Blastocatellia bacterium]